MKRIYNFVILCFIVIFVYLAINSKFEMDCIFKNFFGICCPGCGLTRSFRCILNLDFKNAIYYNILGIPLFIIIIICILMLVKDIIYNSNTAIYLFNKIGKKYYILIIILLIITMTINNIHGI